MLTCKGCIQIFRRRLVVCKITAAPQEVVPVCLSRIPGAVQIVVLSVQLHNIPCMRLTFAGAGDDPGIDAFHIGKQVEQVGIALTDCLFVKQCRIRTVFELVFLICQVIVVVSHIGADVLVNSLDLFIVGLAGQIQLCQHSRRLGLYRLLLLGIGIIAHIVCKGVGIVVAFIINTDSAAGSRHMPTDIITLCALAGMDDRFAVNRSKQCIGHLLTHWIFIFHAGHGQRSGMLDHHRNLRLPGFQALTKLCCCRIQRIGGCGSCRQNHQNQAQTHQCRHHPPPRIYSRFHQTPRFL